MKLYFYRKLIIYIFLGIGIIFFTDQVRAYSCNISVTSTGILYAENTVDSNGTVMLNCIRDASETNTLTYRIKADGGLNANGIERRVQLGATGNYINYYLNRGMSVGGGASCSNSTNWQAPLSGVTDVITGTLDFGTTLATSVIWGYCIRMISISPLPSGGIYTDTIQIYGQYPDSDAGILTASVLLNYTVGVSNQCVFNTFPDTLNFNYTSFATQAQITSQTFNLRCSDDLPWSVEVDSTNNTLLGLNYNLSLNPSTGIGTGLNQLITLTGSISEGQAGTCGTAVCTATQMHTVTISY